MAATERSLDQEFDALRKDLDSLKSTLARKGMKAVDTAVSSARSQGEQGLAALESQIVDRPLTSVLIAFAAGVLIGKLTDN
jgi:ElaB/YqjD/DUF883 family membrane-anchored ribosome-binding protein